MDSTEKPKRRKFLSWLIAFGLLGLSLWGVINYLGNQDDHRTNFRYLAWKNGRSPNDYKWGLHLMMVDASFRESMKGKSIDQLRVWFPETGPAKPGSWQKGWLDSWQAEPDVTCEVIGDSQIAIRLINRKVESFFVMKG